MTTWTRYWTATINRKTEIQQHGDRRMQVLCSPLQRFTDVRMLKKQIHSALRKDSTEVLYWEKWSTYGGLNFVHPMLMKSMSSYAFKMVQWKGKNRSDSLQWNSKEQ